MLKKAEDYVRTIPDFPEPGIMFRDVTSVLQDPDGLQVSIDGIIDMLKGVDFDVVVGPESRVRKKGKLPCETIEATYDLEYGTATIEMHKDSIKPGQKVVIIDDLIATGGTIEAITKLIEQLGGEVVKICFLMELEGLEGRKKLAKYNIDSVIKYPGK